jgi:subtilisin family serine protease
VQYAQPNWVSHIGPTMPGRSGAAPASIDKTPNDPRYGEQWDWPKINAPKAWSLTTGSRAVVVGDIDTGLEYTHEDLAANAWQNTAECNGVKGKDDDHNGYIDDCYGIDTINGDSNPMDDNGHGTHTGGTIGAVGNNGIGVTGINWKVQVLPCKSHDSTGNGSIASIIECYQYMVTEKAAGYDIIATNNSYGGCPEACDYDQATKDGIAAMGKAGILFAVAAANNSSNNDTTPVYPANYFLPNVIAVAATTSTDGLASFSDYGVRTVMVGAPGQSVLSTYRNNGYANLSGTSMATPHVAGLAGLIHAYNPSLNIYQIRNLIIAGGDDITSLAGKTVSGKRIDANGSLRCQGSKVFGLLRPLETVSLADGTQTIAALNINCAKGAGGLSVTIKPGGVQLTLADDGAGVDLKKKDGIYSVAWDPAGSGTYTLKFSNGTSYTVVVTAAKAPVRG